MSSQRQQPIPASPTRVAAAAVAEFSEGQGVTWTGTWATALQPIDASNRPPAPGLSHNTLRQVVYVSIGGTRLRAHFSNAYGESPLEVIGAELAHTISNDTVDPATTRGLRFCGLSSVTIPAGAVVSSDPFEFSLAPQSQVTVTIAFGDTPSQLSGHPGSRTTSYVALGDATGARSFASPLRVEHWYFLAGIDVLGSGVGGAVVTLGDSITDGRGSTTDGNDRWPDNLARRLRANLATSSVAVLNQGIGGNAVLTGGLGPTASVRFLRDVLEPSGVRWAIVLHGVNDIGNARSLAVADELIDAYRRFVAAGRARRVRIYGAPILPFAGSQYDTPEHEAARQKVNAWIRAPHNFDAVIDLDAAVRDPAAPAALLPAYDSGDHLHLSPAGYARMADAIDLTLFAAGDQRAAR